MKNLNVEALVTKITEVGSIWVVKLIGAIAILILGMAFVKMLVGMLRKVMEKSNVEPTLIGFLAGVAKTVLQVVVWLMVLGNLGVRTTSFVAILGSAGLAVGLALQGSLSNLGAGVLLILFSPFKAGDFVSAGGESGTVKEISIFNTVLTTPDNKMIIIPNSKVTAGSITNYSAMETRRVDFTFGIGYDDDLKLAKNTLIEIINADERVLKDPEPSVVVKELGDSSVNFAVKAWVKSGDYWGLYFDVLEKVKLTFDEKGISIPFPQQDVHIHQIKDAA
jgi:small conductance mechanosensitive channel